MSPPCVGNKRIYLWIGGTSDETSMCPHVSERTSKRERERERDGDAFIDELVRARERRNEKARIQKSKRESGDESEKERTIEKGG